MPNTIQNLLEKVLRGESLGSEESHRVASEAPPQALMSCAEEMTLEGHGRRMSYSPKVFIPLTRLCRNSCGYCTFATSPKKFRVLI